MVSGMRTGYPRGLNKRLGSKFHDGSRLRQEGSRLRQESFRVRKEGSRVREGSQVRQEIPEEGRRAYQPKCCTDNNEDEDNSPNTADNTNHQASSQTFREKSISMYNFFFQFYFYPKEHFYGSYF